jgi:hypothetical protein
MADSGYAVPVFKYQDAKDLVVCKMDSLHSVTSVSENRLPKCCLNTTGQKDLKL